MLKFKRFITIIAGVTIIPFLNWSGAWSRTQPLVTTGSCIRPIGRIIYLARTSQICKDEQINIANNTTLICYLSKKIVTLHAGVYKTNSVCNSLQADTVQRCTLITPETCPNRKGPDEENENAPKIVQPYGKIVVNNRPSISWTAVPGATSYIVQVKSYYVNWVKQVNGTTLSYPPEQEELRYGSASKIVVIANKGDSPISADTLVVHLLPEREVLQINQAAQQVASLGLPPDEVLLDLDTIYMSQGLLNKAIDTLQARIREGSQNPALYRILGDRYVDAWWPQQAVSAYKKALELATVQGKKDEQVITQARLKLLNAQSQLPTRMNAAQ